MSDSPEAPVFKRQAVRDATRIWLTAREERKRRRLAVGLAAAVLLLVGSTGAAGLWYIRDRDRREAAAGARREYLEREVTAALEEAERRQQELHRRLKDDRHGAELLSNLDRWRELLESAQAAWTRADRLAAGDRDALPARLRQRLAALEERLQADERERRLAVELDRIRFEASVPVAHGHAIELWRAAPKLARVFKGAHYDLEHDDPAASAARIRESPIRLPLERSGNNSGLRSRP